MNLFKVNNYLYLKLGLVFIGLWAIIVLFFNKPSQPSKEALEFYNTSFSTTVISSGDYEMKGTLYHLANGFSVLNFYHADPNIQIGDQIEKKANTYKYLVLRKDALGNLAPYAVFEYGTSVGAYKTTTYPDSL